MKNYFIGEKKDIPKLFGHQKKSGLTADTFGLWVKMADYDHWHHYELFPDSDRVKQLLEQNSREYYFVKINDIKYYTYSYVLYQLDYIGIDYEILHKRDEQIKRQTINLRKGDKIFIKECSDIECLIEIKEDQYLILEGFRDGEYLSNYVVTCKAIGEYRNSEYGGENPSSYLTYTDIGGKYLFVNDEKICHLHNGFGDGRYHMRFKDNSIVRNF